MERFLNYFVPERYQMYIYMDKHEGVFEGIVEISGKALKQEVKLHAMGLNIKGVKVNGAKWDFEQTDDAIKLSKMPLGETVIRISYDGTLNENMEGAYLSTYEYEGRTEKIIATQFESHYAREAFPCIDEPEAKAVFELTLAVPNEEEDVIISNMPALGDFLVSKNVNIEECTDFSAELVTKTRMDADATDFNRVVAFRPTPRMSTYLLAWVIGKFQSKIVQNSYGVKIKTYCTLNHDADSVDFANEVAAKALEFYEDHFAAPYPLDTLAQVALPDFEAGAMENWGLVTYRESMMLASKAASVAAKKSVALTVAHELAHQWFGDLVTMKWWDDLWLNESFASIMEYYAVDALYPEFRIWEGFFTGDACAALNRDCLTGVQSVHQEVNEPAEIATLFDGAIVYAKGARLMLMLIRLMGWDKFCTGISKYFEKYQYQNTVGDDLWDCLAPYADFDVKQMMHAFIDKPGYPVISSNGKSFEKFTQKRFLLDAPMQEEEWPLPEIREDMSGHYILNLSEAEFKERLARFDELTLEEQLRLLIDRNLVTRTELASPASLVPLALEFRNSNSGAVWNKVVALVGNLGTYCDDESAEEKILKKYALKLVDQKLKEVGQVSQKGDDENMRKLRANLMTLDYFAEDEARLKELANMYDEDFAKMDAEIRDDILSAKLYFEPKMAERFVQKYREISDPEVKYDYLMAALAVKDVAQCKKLLKMLGDAQAVKPQDQLYLFVGLYRNPKTREKAFEWLTQKWDLVRKMGGDKTLSDYPMLVARMARTEQEYRVYKEFFGPMAKDLALSRAVKMGLREIETRLKLIAKNQEAVVKALKEVVE